LLTIQIVSPWLLECLASCNPRLSRVERWQFSTGFPLRNSLAVMGWLHPLLRTLTSNSLQDRGLSTWTYWWVRIGACSYVHSRLLLYHPFANQEDKDEGNHY
jgi:hypothetical protein